MPQRIRAATDDLRMESANLKDKQQTSSTLMASLPKGRRIVSTTASTTIGNQNGANTLSDSGTQHINPESPPGLNWATLETSMLNAYRQAHRLGTPPAFGSSFNYRILSRRGIGQYSPTMARQKARRRINRDNLALAVKKDFNDAMASEPECITSFLYAVHNKGTVIFCLETFV
ncbi:MAG: hypothetical protein Q9190_005409 [Brigantiaea leucoxantha]